MGRVLATRRGRIDSGGGRKGGHGGQNNQVGKNLFDMKNQNRLNAEAVLESIAKQRRYYAGGKGGQLDLYRVAKMILKDYTTGRLCACRGPDGEIYDGSLDLSSSAFSSGARKNTNDHVVQPGEDTAGRVGGRPTESAEVEEAGLSKVETLDVRIRKELAPGVGRGQGEAKEDSRDTERSELTEKLREEGQNRGKREGEKMKTHEEAEDTSGGRARCGEDNQRIPLARGVVTLREGEAECLTTCTSVQHVAKAPEMSGEEANQITLSGSTKDPHASAVTRGQSGQASREGEGGIALSLVDELREVAQDEDFELLLGIHGSSTRRQLAHDEKVRGGRRERGLAVVL